MSTTMEAPPINIDVTTSVLVLQAAAQAGMVDPTKIPESDKDKVEQAESVVKLALQVQSVVKIVGKAKVPKWPDAENVLRAAGMLELDGDQPAALAPAAVPPPSPAPADDWQPPAAPEPTPAPAAPTPPPAPDESPSPAMSRSQAESAADAAEATMDHGDGTWAGREEFIRSLSGLDNAKPISGEFWVNEAGSRFKVVTFGGGPNMEIRFAGTQETTEVPISYAKSLSQQQEDDAPLPATPPLDPAAHNPVPASEGAGQQFDSAEVAARLQAGEEARAARAAAERAQARQDEVDYASAPPGEGEQGGGSPPEPADDPIPEPSKGFSASDLVEPPPVPAAESVQVFPNKKIDVDANGFQIVTPTLPENPTQTETAPSSTQDRVPHDPMRNYVESEDVPNDDGDEVYRGILDDVIKIYSPNGMPVPLDLQNPPSAMPDDLTDVSDIENRRYHSQFNALAARAKFLHDLESAIARKCKFLLEGEMKKAKRFERAEKGDQSKITLEEIKEYAQDHEECVLWKGRLDYHEARADAWKTFFDVYSQNVRVLSRDWTMKDVEREGA
jgi:hypothetical protein